MILKMVFEPATDELVDLPVHYNRPLQGMFYNLLSQYFGSSINSDEREKKIFTFSRIYPYESFRVDNKRLKFKGSFMVYFASPIEELMDCVSKAFSEKELFRIENNLFRLKSHVILKTEVNSPIMVKTVSPITVYSTITLPNKNKYTHYFSPYSDNFRNLISENIKRKASVLGIDFSEDNTFDISPYGVTEKNEKLLFYKGIIIKGWTGYFVLSGNKNLIRLAFDSGLGAKNSQGFGMIIPADHNQAYEAIDKSDDSILTDDYKPHDVYEKEVFSNTVI
ncbi:MAG TPA: CRISPR-associated endoribonuclease Cas6 [Petrotogaceae bacterium]|jgi:CRISPR-associated endoribonuclease Cas6|nr:CRISPR-associated endoribonuclease Cas6 [Petrotogaceae bacterium]HNV06776.1 CRISPR-associated endoribonuclease Cas6 [Petrotogaceae bacterium]HOG34142.1 CRISPR-associated endoribonuclease Cas6 [Petrotogaceae bacterium]HPA92395.1 CRISPR-associated endoribonuclease Cas6 [Petrotogaceae bacterium]HPO26062.1 CRISPR-associated endoribonuclease Cas6 [Petrotogaceae bacterium]